MGLKAMKKRQVFDFLTNMMFFPQAGQKVSGQLLAKGPDLGPVASKGLVVTSCNYTSVQILLYAYGIIKFTVAHVVHVFVFWGLYEKAIFAHFESYIGTAL